MVIEGFNGAIVIVVSTGAAAETVTVVEAENVPAVPVTVVVPADSAVNNPPAFIVPTEPFDLVHAIAVANGAPNWSVVDAINVDVALIANVGFKGEILIAESTGGITTTE